MCKNHSHSSKCGRKKEEETLQPNVWSINTAHLRTIEALQTLNHIRLVGFVCCSCVLMRIKYDFSLFSLYSFLRFAFCARWHVHFGMSVALLLRYCFSEELIKIKSSIQMIKMEWANELERMRTLCEEDRAMLAFLNYMTYGSIYSVVRTSQLIYSLNLIGASRN